MDRSFRFETRDGRAGLVRPARPRDASAVLAIVSEAVVERPRTLAVLEDEMWTARQWRKNRLDWGKKGVWLVAEIDGSVIGQLTCDRASRPTMLHNAEFGITVAARERGQGAGRALMEALEVWADDVGVTRISLGVFGGNVRARALYERLGYEVEGRERRIIRFPEGDVDIVRMSKLLDGPVRSSHGYDGTGVEKDG